MTAEEFLTAAAKELAQAGITSARLDALILLEDELGRDRAHLLAHPEIELTAEQETALRHKLVRRRDHTPLAYIRGKAAFYGRDFSVTEHVLVPRPETEVMIDLLRTLIKPHMTRAADIGTGSGCIAITVALEFPNMKVRMYDVDAQALDVARYNARALHAHVLADIANVLDGIHEPFDILLANLPYVPLDHPINQAARHEPGLALFAGTDGLDLYRTFWKEVTQLHTKPELVLTESLAIQHGSVAALARAASYTPAATQGLIQAFRCAGD